MQGMQEEEKLPDNEVDLLTAISSGTTGPLGMLPELLLMSKPSKSIFWFRIPKALYVL